MVFAHLHEEPPRPGRATAGAAVALDAQSHAPSPSSPTSATRAAAGSPCRSRRDPGRRGRELADVAARAARGRSDLSETEAELADRVAAGPRAVARPTDTLGDRRACKASAVQGPHQLRPTTPTASSAVSDSWPSSSRGSRCAFLAWSAPGAAASRRCSTPGCSPRSTRGRSPSAHWPRRTLRPGEHPPAALRHVFALRAEDPVAEALDRLVAGDRLVSPSISWRSSSPPAAGAGTCGVRRRIVRAAADPERPRGRRRRASGGLLRALRRLSGAGDLLASSQVLVGPLQPSELRRAVALPAAHAGLDVEPGLVGRADRRRRGRAWGAAAPVDGTARAVGAPLGRHHDARGLSRSGGVQGAVARLAEGRTRASRRRTSRSCARSCCAWSTARGRAAMGRRASLRSSSSSATGSRSVLATFAGSRLVTVSAPGSRSRTKRCCASGPAYGTGSRRTTGPSPAPAHRAGGNGMGSRGPGRGELYRGARLAAAADWAGGQATT